MTLNDIKSANWQLSAANPGDVVQGIDDINQCIATIVITVPGSDPFRPTFGCGLHGMIDAPAATAAPVMAARIRDSVTLWEPRIRVVKVSYSIEVENVRFKIEWQLINGFVFGDAEILLGIYDGIIKSSLYVAPGLYYGPAYIDEDGTLLIGPE